MNAAVPWTIDSAHPECVVTPTRGVIFDATILYTDLVDIARFGDAVRLRVFFCDAPMEAESVAYVRLEDFHLN